MSSGELLDIQPHELQFPFELRKQISCSLQLSNKTDNYVAYKVKTTNSKMYFVRPNTGVVLPRSTCDVTVTMRVQKEAPADLQCNDKFLLQSVVASFGTTTEDINPEMFNRQAGHNVEECKLRVVYAAPPRPPSPVREGSDEDSSPRVSVSENGRSNVEFPGSSATEEQILDAPMKGGLLGLGDVRNSMIDGETQNGSPATPPNHNPTSIPGGNRSSREYNNSGEQTITTVAPEFIFRSVVASLGTTTMSSGELLDIQPQELQFPFELRKQISCSLQLSNKTDNYVAYKVKTTNSKMYFVRPNTGVVLPRSTCDVIVTMRVQKEAPADLQCNDKFLLQSVVASLGTTTEDINPEMFNRQAGHNVEECKLRVVYAAPPRPPSPVREGSDEDSSPRVSVSENGRSNVEFPGSSATEEQILDAPMKGGLLGLGGVRNSMIDGETQNGSPATPPSHNPSSIPGRNRSSGEYNNSSEQTITTVATEFIFRSVVASLGTTTMSSGELLDIQPQELQFPFELRKQISCSLQLSNKTDNYVAYKVKTTNSKMYFVRPNTGVVLPRSTCDVTVTMRAQKEAPADLQCNDKFLLQSVVASLGTTTEDINPEMFNRQAGHNVEECKLRVVYAAPPRPPSPVREGSDEDCSPRVSISENGRSNVELPGWSATEEEILDAPMKGGLLGLCVLNSMIDDETQNGSPATPPNHNPSSIPGRNRSAGEDNNCREQTITTVAPEFIFRSVVASLGTTTTSSGELLDIQPQELQFPFELRKQISCSLQLSNKTDNYVAYKFKTTNPKMYGVRPNTGVVLPRSTCDVTVTMQAQKEAPADLQCNDKFLLQSMVASLGTTTEDINPEMSNREAGHNVEECKLRVVYSAPPRPPSPVREGSDEDSSPWVSVSENGRSNVELPGSSATEEQIVDASMKGGLLGLGVLNSMIDGETQNGSPATPPNHNPTSIPGRNRSSGDYNSSGEQTITTVAPEFIFRSVVASLGTTTMSSGELLDIQPQELQFPFELWKQISCSLQLSNKTDNYVAYKVKTTNSKMYFVRPNTGVVLPRSTCDVTVTMRAQKEAPADLQCNDKFLLQSVVASLGTTTEDINPEMFNRQAGHNVEECKLRVVYAAPPRPPSPVREGSDEDSSPRVSISENGRSNVELSGSSATEELILDALMRLLGVVDSMIDGETQNGSPATPPNHNPTSISGRNRSSGEYINNGSQTIEGLSNQTGFTLGNYNGAIQWCGDLHLYLGPDNLR